LREKEVGKVRRREGRKSGRISAKREGSPIASDTKQINPFSSSRGNTVITVRKKTEKEQIVKKVTPRNEKKTRNCTGLCRQRRKSASYTYHPSKQRSARKGRRTVRSEAMQEKEKGIQKEVKLHNEPMGRETSNPENEKKE